MSSTTETPPQTSLGTKLIYVFIVLLWLAAGAAVYVTFFTQPGGNGETTQDEAGTASDTERETEEGADDEEQKQIVLDAEGNVVDPEEANLPRELPDFEFVNQSEETVSKETLLGKPWVITFVFSSCPGPCPRITGRMRQLQEDMKRYDFNLVSLTVKPEEDTPERLTRYADAFSADLSNWHFLTGERPAIYGLIQQGFKMPVADAGAGNVLHSNRFIVVDAKGYVVETYLALEDEDFERLKKYLREIAEKKTEAAAEAGAETPATDAASEPAEASTAP